MNLMEVEIAINTLISQYDGLIDGADITIDSDAILINQTNRSADQNSERTPPVVDFENIQFENQPLKIGKPFSPPKNKPWCRISIDYSGTAFSGFGNKPKFRDFGIISIQCFVPKNTGTLVLARICQEWRVLLESHSKNGLEIYLVHAPQSIVDDDFHAKIIRAEFRVN